MGKLTSSSDDTPEPKKLSVSESSSPWLGRGCGPLLPNYTVGHDYEAFLQYGTGLLDNPRISKRLSVAADSSALREKRQLSTTVDLPDDPDDQTIVETDADGKWCLFNARGDVLYKSDWYSDANSIQDEWRCGRGEYVVLESPDFDTLNVEEDRYVLMQRIERENGDSTIDMIVEGPDRKMLDSIASRLNERVRTKPQHDDDEGDHDDEGEY